MPEESPRFTVRAIVFDLDGVIREWNVEETHAIESRFELPIGAIRGVAFEKSWNRDVVTGVISDEQWRATIASHLGFSSGLCG